MNRLHAEGEADDQEHPYGTWMHGSIEDQEFPCITAFFDESGHSASTRTVAMGGAVTSPRQWGELRLKWKAALQRYGVEVFHMTDFENRRGEFKGWDEQRRHELLTELFAAISDAYLVIMGAVVVVEDFNKLDADIRKRLMDPWYLCHHWCFHEAITSGPVFVDPEKEGIDPDGIRVRACFFEQHRQYKWGPVLFYPAGKAAKERAGAYENGIIGWGTKQTSVHFQLADLIAYEIRKHVENAIYRQGRATRWPMKQFLKGIVLVNVFDQSATEIPTEGGFAMFRNGAFEDQSKGGTIKFVAQRSVLP